MTDTHVRPIKTVQVNVRIHPAIVQRLEAAAQAEYRTTSEVVRSAIIEYLDKRSQPAPASPRT